MVASAELQLKGAAEFTELRRSFYLAGLYTERAAEDGGQLLAEQGPLRMTLKVTVDRWTARSFSNHWSRALLINNAPEQLDAFGEAVIEFSSLPREDLVRGDTLIVDRLQDGSTEVRLNGHPMMSVARSGFTELLLRTWVGRRPPSTGFRQQILGEVDSSEERALLLALAPAEGRAEAIQHWLGGGEASATAAELAPTRSSPQTASTVESQLARPGEQSHREPEVAGSAATETKTGPAVAVTPDEGEVARVESRRPAEPVAMVPSTELEPHHLMDAQAGQGDDHVAFEEGAEELADALSAEEEEALRRIYQNMVVRKILGAVEYPDYALRRGLEGVVQLRIQVNRAGHILDVEQRQGSRYAALNAAARKAVEQARVFPRVPEAMPGELISVDVPIRFQLQ